MRAPSSLAVAITLVVASASPACSRGGSGGSAGEASGGASGSLVVTGKPAAVEEGKPAPTFRATAHDGVAIDSQKLEGTKLLVYFYPKDETPGCTREACAFRDAFDDLVQHGVVLVGVSSDDDASHRAFAQHHTLPFHLVSDPKGALAEAFGVPTRMGFFGRQSFLLGADGTLLKAWREVDVARHAKDVLEAAAP